MALSDPYEAWKRTAGWQINIARQPRIRGRYTLHIRLQRGSTGLDLDNAIKPASDLLQTMHVIDNDRLCQRVTAEWADDADMLEIEVRPA